MAEEETIFDKIAKKEIPVPVVYEDDKVKFYSKILLLFNSALLLMINSLQHLFIFCFFQRIRMDLLSFRKLNKLSEKIIDCLGRR